MEYDAVSKNLVLLMKDSAVIIIRLIDSRINKFAMLENIPLKGYVDVQEKITAVCWLSKLGPYYMEGSSKGKLKIRDMNNSGECIL